MKSVTSLRKNNRHIICQWEGWYQGVSLWAHVETLLAPEVRSSEATLSFLLKYLLPKLVKDKITTPVPRVPTCLSCCSGTMPSKLDPTSAVPIGKQVLWSE